MKRVIVLFVLALAVGLNPTLAQVSVGTPVAETSDGAFQLLWDEDASLLLDQSGTSTTWAPVSLRLVVTEDMNIEAELRNTAEVAVPAPHLALTLMSGGQSFGTETYSSDNEWVPAGGSAYYQYLNVFGGSLFIGDWDETILTIDTDTYLQPNMAAYESIMIDGEKITNSGTQTLGEISFIEVMRDADGIFTNSCFGPETGANLLPGKSVRARGLGDYSNPGGCGFTSEGIAGSESLNIGGPYTVEHVISRIRPPE